MATMSDTAKEALAQGKALADELGKQTRGIKVDMFRKFTSGLKVASSVLPGNPITREYDAGHLVASGGPALQWKIYSGVKKSTKQDVSIFLFEKKSVDGLSRADRERVMDFFRAGVSRLTRLRHPRLLTVQHPLEESRDSIAFCTEPVFASLANIITKDGNESCGIKDFKLHEVEIKYGLLQLAEALTFLHRDVKMLHRNLAPENVYVNRDGAWKLSGFDCCVSNTAASGEEPSYPFQQWDPNLPQICQPNLNYLAPEYFLTLTCGSNSDMYSIGVLFHALFNEGRPINDAQGSYSNQKSAFERRKKSSSTLVLNNIPLEARDHVKLLLNLEPSVRPDADQLVKIPFFEDVGAMALHFLDTVFQKDNLARSKFYRGLPAIIQKLPKRVCHQRVLTCLANELHHKEMVPFILPNIFLIGEDATLEEYASYVQPLLLPLMAVQDPVQILLIFMQNMKLILSKTKPTQIKENVLPMIYRALEAHHPQIQELCLVNLPAFAGLLDYNSIKHSILPRIKKLALESSAVSVRVNCLVCLGQLLEHCDKWLVLDEILPMLPVMKSSEPAVLMAILGIYKTTLTHPKLGITREILGSKVIPFLVPLLMESSLSLPQFEAFSKVIHEMLHQIESERRSQLGQLQTASNEATINDFSEDGLKQMMLNQNGYAGSKPSSSTTTPKPSPTKAASSLTLEEKMRLAKEQENTCEMKRRSPVKPIAVSESLSANSSGYASAQTKDLTQTLMRSVMPVAALSAPSRPNNAPTPAFSGLTLQPSRTGQVMSQMPTPVRSSDPTPRFPPPNFNAASGGFNSSTLGGPLNSFAGGSNFGTGPGVSSWPSSNVPSGIQPMTSYPTPTPLSSFPSLTRAPLTNLSASIRPVSSSSLDNLLPFGNDGKGPSLKAMATIAPFGGVSRAPVAPLAPPPVAATSVRPNSIGASVGPSSRKADAVSELSDFLG